MRIFVDTNVLADVVHNDPLWADWSEQQLERHSEGLVINSMVYAELCYHAQSTEEVDNLVSAFGLHWEEIPRKALFVAAQAFRLTRDVARYKTYFPSIPLLAP